MKIEDLIEKIGASEELQGQLKELLEQGNKDAAQAWVKKQGCDAPLSEIKQYLVEKGEEMKDSGELTPEQLEAAAGGTWSLIPFAFGAGLGAYMGWKGFGSALASC